MNQNKRRFGLILSISLLSAFCCSAQTITSQNLIGKWHDSRHDDSTTYFMFLTDSSLLISIKNQVKNVNYTLDVFHYEQRLNICMPQEDTIICLRNFIRLINTDTMVLEDYSVSKSNQWEAENEDNSIQLVREKAKILQTPKAKRIQYAKCDLTWLSNFNTNN